MTTALGTLTATRDLGENESLAQFGLDEPVLTVCATANGEEHIYYYGDTNEVTGEVYLMVEGETSLYTVSSTSLNVFQVHCRRADPGDHRRGGTGGKLRINSRARKQSFRALLFLRGTALIFSFRRTCIRYHCAGAGYWRGASRPPARP